MNEEDEEFERIAAKCKETQRVNESKWRSEMCSNYGGFCKKEWVGLTDEEYQDILTEHDGKGLILFYHLIEEKLKGKNS